MCADLKSIQIVSSFSFRPALIRVNLRLNAFVIYLDTILKLHLQLAVFDARRQRVQPATRRPVKTRSVRGEITIVTGTRENILVISPGDFAAFVWTDSRKHLIVFAR